MNNQWLRLWHDMPTDPKWRTIARVSKQPISVVIAVYVHLLVSGSCNAMKRGETQCNAEDVTSSLDLEEGQVEAILAAMQGRVLDGNFLTGWDSRQPSREDHSYERVKKHRENKRLHDELKVNSSYVTQCNAVKRSETLREDKDKDKDKEYKTPLPPFHGGVVNMSFPVSEKLQAKRKSKASSGDSVVADHGVS